MVHKKTPQNPLSSDLISEIKKGVKLRSAAERKASPMPPKVGGVTKKDGIDMGNLGLMASELAKQRQKRVQAKQPDITKVKRRESHTLNQLLKELDSL